MIEKLQNSDIEVSKKVYSIFQSSYAVEAKLLDAIDFPPLKRPLESYLKSGNVFFGYFVKTEMAGVIEIEFADNYIDINSLVVNPKFFRRGIARMLLEFIFDECDSQLFIVETGVNNEPAIELYKKLGFKEINQWDTDFGIRKVKFRKTLRSKHL